MKTGEKRLLIFEISLFVILFLNSFVYNILTGLRMSIFLGLVFVLFRVIFGFENSRFRVTKESILDTIIFLLSFFLIYYVFGIFIGFAKVGNYFTWGGIRDYILPLILNIIFREIIRFNFLQKSNENKMLIISSIFVFALLDMTNAIYYGSFYDSMHIFKFVALTFIPAISYNLYATYVSKNAGFKSILIYALTIGLYVYIIPLVPNADEYLTSLVNFLLPLILLYRIYSTVKNENDEQISREYGRKDYVTLGIGVVIVMILVYFSSGYFTYHAVAIATGSMSPAINRGDIVIIKKTKDINSIEIGDVIAYNYHNVLVVHRLAKKVKVDNEFYYYSKGDNNKEIDNYIIKEDMIIGVVNTRIPYLGMPTVWLNEMWEE